jgi:hypothetical protein
MPQTDGESLKADDTLRKEQFGIFESATGFDFEEI